MIENDSIMDRPIDTKRSRNRRLIRIGLLIVLPLVLLASLYPSIRTWLRSERSIQLARVRIGQVVRGDLVRDVKVQGRIVAAFHPTTFSPARGIVNLRVLAGETVKKGQVLAVVQSPELESVLEQARSTLRSLESDLEREKIEARQTMLADRQKIDLAEVELEAARRAMERARRSRVEGIINDVEYEKAQDDLRRSEVELAHARQNAELEEETLEFEVRNGELQVERQQSVFDELSRQVKDLTVRAPVAGLASRIDVEDHDAVTQGQPLVAVVDLSAFEVEILVPESYADEIGAGTPAEINYDGRVWSGSVKSISPEVEGNQVRGIVAFEGEMPDGLRQNQRVSTRVILESRHDILKVDRGPFLDGGGGRIAYIVRGSLAERISIQSGSSSVEEVEILSGLGEGDRIIISDIARFENAESIYLRD